MQQHVQNSKHRSRDKARPQVEASEPETDHGFDKYEYYQNSVQSPEEDVKFLAKTFKELRNKEPVIMREDFCAAFALCCEWVKIGPQKEAIAIDIDEEPLDYGRTHYLSKLDKGQQERVKILQSDVLKVNHEKADIICALNFSYMILKERPLLKAYLESCYKNLSDDGIVVFDCFGGPDTQAPNVHETEHERFSYFWDQDTFNPLTNEAMFYIHFKLKGQKKRFKVFTYDWRIWSLAELRDLFLEVGFKDPIVYWEGTDEDGDGDGEFTPTKTGEECDSWVAYIVGQK